MTDYKKIIQTQPIPRIIGTKPSTNFVGSYIATPSVPTLLQPYQSPWVIINVGINIFPETIPLQIRKMVEDGLMTKDNAIKYLEKLIEYAEDVLRELKE
jgi:hypothetical protein